MCIRGNVMHKNLIGTACAVAVIAFSPTFGPANAADLGGDCCADLEERVAELEATTARKGNRVVSLTVSGQVSKALLFFDDGFDSDAFVVDNSIQTSRIGLSGKGQVSPGLSAGYVMELDIRDSPAFLVSQNDDEGPGADSLTVRLNYVYLDSASLGKISLGQNYSFNDAVSVPLQVVNVYNTDGSPYADSFRLIGADGQDAGFNWSNLLGLGPRRDDYVRYDSPTFGGFSVTALAGDDDVWEVGAKYLGTLGRIRLHAAIDYFNYDAGRLAAAGFLETFEDLKGLVSFKDLPTGLFLTTLATQRDYERAGLEDTGYALQFFGGIEMNFFGYGNTTLYGGYGRYEDMASTGLEFNLPTGGTATVIGSEIDRLTFGIVQTIDSAAFDVYAIVEHYSAEIDTEAGPADVEDFTEVLIGSRIKF